MIWKKDFSLSESFPTGITQIVDWNQDGIHDVSVTLVCGAGPNCETQHYNIDQKTDQQTRRMTAVGTTYGITQVISGYLVDMSRNNC